VWKKIRKNSTKVSNVVGNYTLLCKNKNSKSVRKFVKYQKTVVHNLVEKYVENKSDEENIKKIKKKIKDLSNKEIEDLYYHQIFADAEVQEHSKKPQFVYDIIFQMFYLTTSAELFARQKKENFKSFGNEIEKFKNYLYDEKKASEIKKIQEWNHIILEKYSSFQETSTKLRVGTNSKIYEINRTEINNNKDTKISIINQNYTLTQLKEQKIVKFKKLKFEKFETYKKKDKCKKRKRKKENDLIKKEKELKKFEKKLKEKEKELKILEEKLNIKEKEIELKKIKSYSL